MHPANASSGLFSLTFRDALYGVAVGGDYANPKNFSGPNVVLTTDGGQTWRAAGRTDPAGLYFSSVAFLPNSGDMIPSSTGTIWAAGSNGMNSAQAGSPWRSEGSENFNAVAFPISRTGWTVGPEGRVARWEPFLHFTTAWALQASVNASTQQLVLVTTQDWTSPTGILQRFEKIDGAWKPLGGSVPVALGRNGLGTQHMAIDSALGVKTNPLPNKQEGDGRSPAGIFSLTTLFGFSPQSPNPRMPYHPLTGNTVCVDDPHSLSYNHIVEADRVALPDWNSGEEMRAIPEYREGVVIGYNDAAPRAGHGSCIFLHSLSSPKQRTAGCTAMDSEALSEVIRWLDASKQPVLAQMPEAEYQRRKAELKLP
jgi:D-alanyl-D-alanine dipeptidase